MTKFTKNAYEFINEGIGFNKDFKVNINGDFHYNGSLSALFYEYKLKKMTITDFEIQYNEIWLIVKEQENGK